nr:hypothetical protein [Janibacter limosus]
MTLPPRRGSAGTSTTTSTGARAVWMTRGVRTLMRHSLPDAHIF